MTAAFPLSHQALRAALLDRQADLNSRLAAIETALDAPAPADWEDMATAREDDEVLQASGLSGQHELRQIAAAIDRIDRGEYGACMKCGRPIAAARLAALPYTPHCRNCAS
ncbi:MAG: TraR/DksA C4-type zinc finger protein [Rhodobacteraceae bacterium]|jgi:RNA polymerase-binding transcription factor DksA|nr:TraR/DksA C4-type zinc finger protein [Paracoccaceae bacterium]